MGETGERTWRQRAIWIQRRSLETTVYSDGGRLMSWPVMRSLGGGGSQSVMAPEAETAKTDSSWALHGRGVVT